jgi:hypothetical protein
MEEEKIINLSIKSLATRLTVTAFLDSTPYCKALFYKPFLCLPFFDTKMHSFYEEV